MVLLQAWMKAPTAVHVLIFQYAAQPQKLSFSGQEVDSAVTAAPSGSVATGCVPS